MAWNSQDKPAALYLLVELAAQLNSEEVFQFVAQINDRLHGRLEVNEDGSFRTKYPGLGDCLRSCLKQHGVI
jgi:hypothetical protein